MVAALWQDGVLTGIMPVRRLAFYARYPLPHLTGSKVMTQFPAGDPRYAPDTTHESYHTGARADLV